MTRLIPFFLLLLISFSTGIIAYQEIAVTYYDEKNSLPAPAPKTEEAYFLAKIPLDPEGKNVRYGLFPAAKRDLFSRRIKFDNDNLYAYNHDGSLYAQIYNVRTTTDKDNPESAINNLMEMRDATGAITETFYSDAKGRSLRLANRGGTKEAGLFSVPGQKALPISQFVAELVLANELDLAQTAQYSRQAPDFLTAIEKDGKLVDAQNRGYELTGNGLQVTRQTGNVEWGTLISPEGSQQKTLNGYPIAPDVAFLLEQKYGNAMTTFDGQVAYAGDRQLVIEADDVRVLQDGQEIERITLLTEGGIKKVAVMHSPAAGGYSQREVQWKDELGTHKRAEKLSSGVAIKADEELIDSQGKKYFLQTSFAGGKPVLSFTYDSAGYPAGRIAYDADGKPVAEQSATVEYLTPAGKVCDPTRDYFCPYQRVQMRIKVGNTAIMDECRGENCKTVGQCRQDPKCNRAFSEMLQAYQRANFGIALNNAYIAARGAERFNVRNFGFIENFFSSGAGRWMIGEPDEGRCGQFAKRRASQEGVLVHENNMKTLLAYVAAERTTLKLPNETKEYLYKINYFVDAQLEDITINIDLYRANTAIITLFTGDLKVPKGQQSAARGDSSIMQYSKNFYDKLCLRTSKGMTCNRIIDVTELSRVPEQPQEVSMQQRQKGGINVF